MHVQISFWVCVSILLIQEKNVHIMTLVCLITRLFFKMLPSGAEEMTQWVRVMTVLPEELGQISSIQMLTNIS